MILEKETPTPEVEEILKLIKMLSDEELRTIEEFKRNIKYVYLGYLPVNTWYEVRE